MTRDGIFEAEDPIALARAWLKEAEATEVNDPNAMALSTVDAAGQPNVRIVLLKDIADDGFVFYTNYESAKAQEIAASGRAAFVLHWKSLRRQIRVRGTIDKVDGATSDAYYRSRPLESRIGAWASPQSTAIASREDLTKAVDRVRAEKGADPARPSFWGGYKIVPYAVEFWANGPYRLHDRFVWTREKPGQDWSINRLAP